MSPSLRFFTHRTLSALLTSAMLGSPLVAPLHAAEPVPAKDGHSEMVIVPYDPSRPVAEQKPDQYYLPYEHFLDLWEAAKRHRKGPEPEASPALFALSAARYEGTADDQAVMLTGRIDLTTYNDAWTKVPLAFAGARVSSLKLDGQPVASDAGQIVVEKPGRHVVEVSLEIPRLKDSPMLDWDIPETAATRLSLVLPETRSRLAISPSVGTVEQIETDRKRVTAILGTTGHIHVERLAPINATKLAEAASATVRTQLLIQPGRERFVSEFVFDFSGAKQDRFTVSLDEGLTLTGLDALNAKSWNLTDDGKRQTLEVILNEPANESYTLRLECERPLGNLPVERTAPVFSAVARRVEYRAFAFCPAKGLELTATPASTQRQVPWENPLTNDLPATAAFSGEGAAAYRLSWAATRREAEVNYVYQISRRQIELIASLQLYARGDELSTAVINLPAEFDVQGIESSRLQDWWRQGDALYLRFKNATPEVTPLVVYLVRQYAAAPTELDVRPLSLQGFKKITGGAVLAAHKGVDVALRLSGEAREVPADQAATDFQILAPLERKRGFAFKDQTFAGQVSLKALPAKTSATWVLHAQAHEGWVGLSLHGRLAVRQGSVDRLVFSWPASMPEARVSGAEVRETRTRIEGDRRIYEVQFQNDIAEQVEWTADVELPNPGQFTLPAPAFPETPSTTGFVLTENSSESEMTTRTSGVDPVELSAVPFLPTLSTGAGVFRVQSGWSVTLGIDRLEKAATRSAFVAWAEMTTALRRDGTEWHRAVYHLQNRTLQFLPVKLPEDAELMSVQVAGDNVRADTGTISGQTAILVPLIKTKPGDLSYDVELVYRLSGKPLHWWSHRGFKEPELLGITVERTFWNVWVPDDYKLQTTDGNMETVIAEVNQADRLEGNLQEWKALAAIANSPQVSAEARANALASCQLLQTQIEQQANDGNLTRFLFSRREAPEPTPGEEAVGKKGVQAQGEYAARKGRAIIQELQAGVTKLKSGSGTLVLNGPQSASTSLAIPAAPAAATWQSNGTVAPTPTPQTTANNAAGNNIYFNDHVVLQQQVQLPPGPAQPQGAARNIADDVTTANNAPATKSTSTAFNTARGNRLLAEEEVANNPGLEVARQTQSEFQRYPNADATAPTGGFAPSPGNIRPSEAKTFTLSGTVSAPAFAPAMAPSPVPPASAPAPAKPATGRVSLNVDFPTEGQELHFKKVKANASLELGLLAPAAFERWKYLACALVLGLALLGIRRMTQPMPGPAMSRG